MTNTLPFNAAAFIQFQITPAQPEMNIQKVTELIKKYKPQPTTVMVLPELWSVGFENSNKQQLTSSTPETLESMRIIAANYDIYLAGSLPYRPDENQKPLNTLFLVGPGGVVGSISKQYMFSHWKEERYYQPGRDCLPMELDGCKIGGMVCYDLRFPEVAREQSYLGAKIILVSAQWPITRRDHWLALLRARAIENQVFIVASNGCGVTGSIELGGSSAIISPGGEMMVQAANDELVGSVPLDMGHLKEVRKFFCPPGESPWRSHDAGKILTREILKEKISSIRKQGAKIAFTNGCFDILHAGHVSYLERARETADCLIVGLNSDASIRRLKGEERPVNSEIDRARVLAALGCVDFIVLFEEDTPLDLITYFLPDVLVKGADWEEEEIVGAKEVKAAGGRVERIVFEYDRSTTGLIDRIRQSRNN